MKKNLIPVPEEDDRIGTKVVDAAYKVHTALGPGLLETAYEVCLEDELLGMGLKVQRQKEVPVQYNGKTINTAFRADMVVQERVLVELKSVDAFAPVHFARLMTYLRLSHLRLGYLINFNLKFIKFGIRRIVV